ncbi:MAG: GIY-YIG nuclease family protein [Candidatus Omnitrophica bacterium]|nr:GIY-YIG nuclease family protein [Candidatus Omnitrophota bacterium]
MVKKSGNFSVYILECKDRTYYTGYTNDLERRINEHNDNKRGAKYTRYKRPVKLIWSKEYRYLKDVMCAERLIKKLQRRDKIKVITGERVINVRKK